jgi:hypothetical protein
MTDLVQPAGAASPQLGDAEAAPLDVRLADVMTALVTFAASLTVLAYGMSAQASFVIFLLLHVTVLAIPAWLLARRVKHASDLTVPVLLLIATAAAGPIGAVGCAFMALSLWYRQPTPWRLRHWYDYISGVVARARVAHLYDELVAGRLPPDPAAMVPRFNPILHDTSLEDQQRVLGVIGRRYHAAFRPALRKAMRHKNGFIRAQAAAIASSLSADEKARLWSTAEPPDCTAQEGNAVALDVEPPRP